MTKLSYKVEVIVNKHYPNLLNNFMLLDEV